MNYTNLILILCIFLMTILVQAQIGPSTTMEGFSADVQNALNAPVNYLNNAPVSDRNQDIGGTGGGVSGAAGESISVDPIPPIPVNQEALREDACMKVTGLAGLQANPKCGFCHTDGKGHTKDAQGNPSFVNCPTWSPTVEAYLKYVRRQQCSRIKLPQDISQNTSSRKGCGFCLMSGKGAQMENGAPKYPEDAECAPLSGTRGKETEPSFVTDISRVPARIQDMLNYAGEAANVARSKGQTNDPCPEFITVQGVSILSEQCALRAMNNVLNESVNIGVRGGPITPNNVFAVFRGAVSFDRMPDLEKRFYVQPGSSANPSLKAMANNFRTTESTRAFYKYYAEGAAGRGPSGTQVGTFKAAWDYDQDICNEQAPGTATGLMCIKKLFEEEGCKMEDNEQAPNEQNQAEFDAAGSVEQIRKQIHDRKMQILSENETHFVDGRKFCYGVEKRPISTTALSNKMKYAIWYTSPWHWWSARRPIGFNPIRGFHRQDTIRTLDITRSSADAQIHWFWHGQAKHMFLLLIRGMIKAPETGYYTFRGGSDDHLLVTLNHKGENQEPELIIEAPFYQGKTWYESKRIFLKKDHQYPFNIWHGQGWGGQNMHIQWKMPGKSSQENIDPELLYENNLAPQNVKEITITKQHWEHVNLNELEVYDENDENVFRSGKQGKIDVISNKLGHCNRRGYYKGCDPKRIINGKKDFYYQGRPYYKDGSTNYIHSVWPNERFTVRIQFEKPIKKVRYVKLFARGRYQWRSTGLCINFRSEYAPEVNRPENKAAHEHEYQMAPSWRGHAGWSGPYYWNKSNEMGHRFTYPPAAVDRIRRTMSTQHAAVQANRSRYYQNRDSRGMWLPDHLWQTTLITDDRRYVHEFAFPEQSLLELNQSVEG